MSFFIFSAILSQNFPQGMTFQKIDDYKINTEHCLKLKGLPKKGPREILSKKKEEIVLTICKK